MEVESSGFRCFAGRVSASALVGAAAELRLRFALKSSAPFIAWCWVGRGRGRLGGAVRDSALGRRGGYARALEYRAGEAVVRVYEDTLEL